MELRALVTERKHEFARGALELLHENASDATVFCKWEQVPREQKVQEQAIRPWKIDPSFMKGGKPDEHKAGKQSWMRCGDNSCGCCGVKNR